MSKLINKISKLDISRSKGLLYGNSKLLSEDALSLDLPGDKKDRKSSLRSKLNEKSKNLIEFVNDDNMGVHEDEENFHSDFRMFEGRTSLKTIAHHLETKQFIYQEHYGKDTKKQKRMIKESYLQNVEENLGSFTEEPKVGIRPVGANNKEFKKKYNIEYKKILPSLFTKHTLTALKPYEQFTFQEKIIGLSQLKMKNPDVVTLIRIENQQLHGGGFVKEINKFKNCLVLILKNTKIGHSLKTLNMPKLRFLDLTGNAIESYLVITTILDTSPNLETIIVENNMFMTDPTWRRRLIIHGKMLKKINQDFVTEQERQAAIAQFGDVNQKSNQSLDTWVLTLDLICKSQNMMSWQPGRITSLSVANSRLSEFHVGVFKMLRELNISKNQIKSIKGAGLEQLDYLKVFNFSNNLVSRIKELKVLRYLPSIKYVWCENNKFKENPKDVMLKIIFETRNAKGTNRSPGLIMANGKDISIEDRIEAARKFKEKLDSQTRRMMRWSLLLIEKYGHIQLRCVPHFAKRIKILDFPKLKLKYVDISGFRRLEYLCLEKNKLRHISGIQKTKRLMYLDVAHNPDLDLKGLLKDLTKINNLRTFHVTKYSPDDGEEMIEQRKIILKTLVPIHPRLSDLDNKVIDIDERIDAMSSILNTYQKKKYRFNLNVVQQIISFEDMIFSHRKVQPSRHHPVNIYELVLNNCKLEDTGCNFDVFVSLEKLDVSQNKLQDIKSIGLNECTKLKVVDFRENKIDYSVKALVEFIDNFKFLTIIAFRGNPCYKNIKKRERIPFLKKLQSLKTVAPRLQVVDSDITNKERLEIMKHHGLSLVKNDAKSFKEVMKARGYLDMVPSEVNEIQIIDAGLRKTNFKEFVNLEILILRGNRIQTLEPLSMLDNLRVLDVRKNSLSEIDEVVNLIIKLKYLESIGVSGNLFSQEKKVSEDGVRQYIIGNVKKLRKRFCHFWEINEQKITVDEICESWALVEKTPENENEKISEFRFGYNVMKKFVTHINKRDPIKSIKVVPTSFEELNLFNHKLRVIRFSKFKELKVLSLKQNDISGVELAQSGLNMCKNLEKLDISFNKIKNLGYMVKLVDELENLKMFNCEGNPCYPTEDNTPVRLGLIGSLKEVVNIGFKLSFLNEIEITIGERCEALKRCKSQMSEEQIEIIRTKFLVEKSGYTGKESSIQVIGESIKKIEIFLTYKNLTHLDLMNNEIEQLPKNMKDLENLIELNIQNNRIELDDIIEKLQFNINLQYLKVKGNKNCGKTIDYLFRVISHLRGLKQLDEYHNPIILSPEQMIAVNYLEKKYGISRNSLNCIDLTHKHIERNSFWAILLCLRTLTVVDETRENIMIGPRDVKLKEGNFESSFIQNYRFLMISHCSALETLDDRKVTDEEKQTAVTIKNRLNNLVLRMIKEYPNLNSSLDYIRVRDHIILKSNGKIKLVKDEDVRELDEIGEINEYDDDDDLLGSQDEKSERELKEVEIQINEKSDESTESEDKSSSSEEEDDDDDESSEGEGEKKKKKRKEKKKKKKEKEEEGEKKDDNDEFVPDKKSVKSLVSMGFGKKKAARALFASGNDQQKAVELLIEEKPLPQLPKKKMKESKEKKRKKSSKKEKNSENEVLTSTDINFDYIEKNFKAIELFKVYSNLLNETNNSARSWGNLLEKAENIIVFFQMFSIIFSFNVNWPTIFKVLFQWLTLTILGFENINEYPSLAQYMLSSRVNYLRFIFTVCMPLFAFILFVIQFNHKHFLFLLGKLKIVSGIGYFFLWIIGVVISLGIAIVFDETAPDYSFYPSTLYYLFPPSGTTPERRYPSNSFFIIFFLSLIIVTMVIAVLYLNMVIFNLKKRDMNFWSLFYCKFRRRLAFFLLSISYFPLMRVIFLSFECQESLPFIDMLRSNNTTIPLRLYEDTKCPNFAVEENVFFDIVPVMWYLSLLFALFYGIGIPLLMIFMILRDWPEMFHHFSLEQDDQKIKLFEKRITEKLKNDKQIKQKLKEMKKEREIHYHRCTLDYNSAPSLLYSPFKRFFRYYKIVHYFERLILCVIASLLYGGELTYIQIISTMVIMGVLCLATLVLRMYFDWYSTLLDIINRISLMGNLVAALIIVILTQNNLNSNGTRGKLDGTTDVILGIILVLWNLANFIISFIIILIPIIKKIIAASKEGEVSDVKLVQEKETKEIEKKEKYTHERKRDFASMYDEIGEIKPEETSNFRRTISKLKFD